MTDGGRKSRQVASVHSSEDDWGHFEEVEAGDDTGSGWRLVEMAGFLRWEVLGNDNFHWEHISERYRNHLAS